MTPEQPPADGLGFDALLERLRDVVDRLERGNLGLEESLAAYEAGVALARRGHELLDRAEKRVELLVSSSNGGQTVPLDALDGGDAGEPEDRGR